MPYWHCQGSAIDWWALNPCWVGAHDSGEAFDRLEDMRASGASYPMIEAVTRDGLFEQDAIFLVFEKADLERLAAMINAAIGTR